MNNNELTTDNTTAPQADVDSVPADLSVYVAPTVRKPGELGFAVIATLLGVLGYYFAMDMTSETFSSPSVFPKIASVIIVGCGVYCLCKAVKRDRPPAGETTIHYLLPRDVTFMILMIVVYSIALPRLHFIPSSYGFMVIGMIYLNRGKKIPQSFFYSAIALAVLVAVFRFLFMVILP